MARIETKAAVEIERRRRAVSSPNQTLIVRDSHRGAIVCNFLLNLKAEAKSDKKSRNGTVSLSTSTMMEMSGLHTRDKEGNKSEGELSHP